MQTTPSEKPQPGREVMRAISNNALVEEAARKALSQQELEKTITRFRELCSRPGQGVQELDEVGEILRNAGFKNELMNVLREALRHPGTNPHVGALWVRRLVLSKIWDHGYPDGLDALCKQGEIGHCAVIEFIKLAGTKRRAELVRLAVSRHRGWLRKDVLGWHVAGRALVEARCYRQAVGWMSAWRDKSNLELPTLHCLALALRATGRRKASNEVVQQALSRPDGATAYPIFKLWAAQDEALRGETQSASTHLKQVDTSGWDDDSLALFYLVRGVVRVQRADAEDREETFGTARDRIHDVFRKVPIYKRDVYLRREYRRCLTRMAKDSGAWSQLIPPLWKSAESKWFLVPLLAVPGLQLFLPCYVYRLCSRRRGVVK
jgi:hypothetical protein